MNDLNRISKLASKKVFSIEGNIGAGKSTILRLISASFNDVEFIEEPVKEWQNLGGENLLDAFYKDPKRWGYSFEFYSMLSRIEALLKAADSDKPIIVIERSILSNKIFIDISKEMGKLEPIEYSMLMNTYDFYIKIVYPCLAGMIYVKTPVSDCVKRIALRNRGEETGIDPRYLETLESKFDNLANSGDIKTLVIDGLYNFKRDQISVAEQIKSFMHPNNSLEYTD